MTSQKLLLTSPISDPLTANAERRGNEICDQYFELTRKSAHPQQPDLSVEGLTALPDAIVREASEREANRLGQICGKFIRAFRQLEEKREQRNPTDPFTAHTGKEKI